MTDTPDTITISPGVELRAWDDGYVIDNHRQHELDDPDRSRRLVEVISLSNDEASKIAAVITARSIDPDDLVDVIPNPDNESADVAARVVALSEAIRLVNTGAASGQLFVDVEVPAEDLIDLAAWIHDGTHPNDRYTAEEVLVEETRT